MIILFTCLLGIILITLILFLPVYIELKKPKDNGPRQIVGVKADTESVLCLEEEINFEAPLTMLPSHFDALTNLEV
jgi:hypothetical protein